MIGIAVSRRGNDAAQVAIHQADDGKWRNEQWNENYHSFILHIHEPEDVDGHDGYPEEL